jgi:hypothetical protein
VKYRQAEALSFSFSSADACSTPLLLPTPNEPKPRGSRDERRRVRRPRCQPLVHGYASQAAARRRGEGTAVAGSRLVLCGLTLLVELGTPSRSSHHITDPGRSVRPVRSRGPMHRTILRSLD